MKKKCPKCGKTFRIGYDGIDDPVGCDVCLGVERIADFASEYSAWLPDEKHHYYEDGLWVLRVTREGRSIISSERITLEQFDKEAR
jgi:hypothetical protein